MACDLDAIRARRVALRDSSDRGPAHPWSSQMAAADADLADLCGEVETLRLLLSFVHGVIDGAVGDLLAALLGDGGHRQAEVGTEQAAREALERVHALHQRVAEAPSAAEVESLRRQVARLAGNLGRYGRGILGCAASGCEGCMVCDPEGQVAAALRAVDEERAAVVAFLRGPFGEVTAQEMANDIEEGKHHVDE